MLKKKIVHTELDDLMTSRFDLIKSHLGLKNDGEVIRFLISGYFNMNLKLDYEKHKQQALKEYESEIGPMLSGFMEKYGDQWRKLGEDE